MAEKELEIKITWENNNFFKMEKKPEGGDWITVVLIEENAHIGAVAGGLQSLCLSDFNAHLVEIIGEMKSEGGG